MSSRWRVVLPPIIPFVVVTAGVEVLVRSGVIPSYVLPAPSAVFASVVRDFRELSEATWSTTKASVAGFAASGVVGVLIAVALSSSRWVERAFYPYAIFFQTVPIIAIAPLLVIWFGFDLRTVIASAFIVSVFPVIANTLTGLLSTDPALRDLFRLYGA